MTRAKKTSGLTAPTAEAAAGDSSAQAGLGSSAVAVGAAVAPASSAPVVASSAATSSPVQTSTSISADAPIVSSAMVVTSESSAMVASPSVVLAPKTSEKRPGARLTAAQYKARKLSEAANCFISPLTLSAGTVGAPIEVSADDELEAGEIGESVLVRREAEAASGLGNTPTPSVIVGGGPMQASAAPMQNTSARAPAMAANSSAPQVVASSILTFNEDAGDVLRRDDANLLRRVWENYWVWDLRRKERKRNMELGLNPPRLTIPMHSQVGETAAEYEAAFLDYVRVHNGEEILRRGGNDERNLWCSYARYRAHNSPDLVSERADAFAHPLAKVYSVADLERMGVEPRRSQLPRGGSRRSYHREHLQGESSEAPRSRTPEGSRASGPSAPYQTESRDGRGSSQRGSGGGQPSQQSAGAASVRLRDFVEYREMEDRVYRYAERVQALERGSVPFGNFADACEEFRAGLHQRHDSIVEVRKLADETVGRVLSVQRGIQEVTRAVESLDRRMQTQVAELAEYQRRMAARIHQLESQGSRAMATPMLGSAADPLAYQRFQTFLAGGAPSLVPYGFATPQYGAAGLMAPDAGSFRFQHVRDGSADGTASERSDRTVTSQGSRCPPSSA
jgi:hypothetical protein